MKTNRILLAGLGGGLDVINVLYFKYKIEEEFKDEKVNIEIILGSIRPLKGNLVEKSALIDSHIFEITKDTKITQGGRYAEPKLAELLNEPVYIFSRINQFEKRYNAETLAQGLDGFIRKMEIDEVFFIDGGGDSMILRESDSIKQSQEVDPFKGGDAFALRMISLMEVDPEIPITLITIAVGLDVNIEAFIANLISLKKEKIFYSIGTLNALDEYNEIAEQILYLKEGEEGKFKSHTATTFYHALNKNFGLQRTFVNWEPKQKDGEKGVIVNNFHTLAFYFDAKKIHSYKEELNKRTWHYVQKPVEYGIECDICNGNNLNWSEYKGKIWCYDCKKDTKGTGGVFNGPIPINTAQLLGISFDIYNMLKKEVIEFESEEWKKIIKQE